ncbi:MAG TPA: SpoVG family protein [Bacillota bacterium]|nr:SpoVG family protein [Bacillota bacterium]
MNITEVRIHPINAMGNTRAFASVTIDDALVIHDMRIVNGRNGLFVSMPSKKVGDKYFDISHPITAVARENLFKAVLQEYHESVVTV